MARAFNGTTDVAVSNVPNGYQEVKITVSFWLYQTADMFPNYGIVVTYDQPHAAQTGCFYIAASTALGAGVGLLTFSNTTRTKFWQDSFPRPSLNAWHHWLYVADQAGPSHSLWIDGAPVALGAVFTRHDAGPFDKFLFGGQYYVGAESIGPLTNPQAMRIAELGILDGNYGLRQAQSLASGAAWWDQPQDRQACYWSMVAGESPEPRWNGPDFDFQTPVNLALTGTTFAAHPPNVRTGIRGRLAH